MTTTTVMLIAPAVITSVAYLFGCVKSMRDKKGWLIPNGRFWGNIAHVISMLLKSFAGIAPPAPYVARSDSDYYPPTPEEFKEAHEATCALMIDTGWTLKEYLPGSNDCDDYGPKMAVEIRKYISDKWSDKIGKRGVFVSYIGYIIHQGENKGGGHVDVCARLSTGEVVVHWPYPEEKHRAPKTLSQADWDSVSLDIM